MIENWLCAPDRMKWVTRSKKKGGKCVFCRISEGDHDADSLVLHKTRKFMVIMNLYPYNTGHIQVLPRRHAKSLEDLTDKEVADLSILVKKCIKMLKKAMDPLGFNVGFNQGGDASGASFEHLHVHIVPRFKTDYGFIDIIGGTKVLPEKPEDTFKRLQVHKKMLK